MASTKAKKVQLLDVDLETKAGALARVYRGFKESGVNIVWGWAYEMGPGQAKAHFHATDLGKAKDTLSKLGLKPTTSEVCVVEGEDRVGVYADVLDQVAKAGVNITATDAFGVGGKFATAIFCDPKDLGALCKALGC